MSSQNLASAHVYSQASLPNMQHENNNAGMDHLLDSFGNIDLRGTSSLRQGKTSNASLPVNGVNAHHVMGTQNIGPMLYQLPDGVFVYSGSDLAQGSYPQYSSGYNLTAAHPSTYQYQQPAYNGMQSAGPSNGTHTPHGQPWMPPQGLPQVPELMVPRRTSWSSVEEASPLTPASYGDFQPGYVVQGRSPTSWSTPSPTTTMYPIIGPHEPHCRDKAKNPNGDGADVNMWEWTHREGNGLVAIPEPVPALRSGDDGGRGSLDKILDNRDGTTNVYVRGLQPDTTDELLLAYGLRFGPIESQKAIIDHTNGKCKGFGFIKYKNFIDAENCIRGFFYRHYEAKFARQSHNARLKDLAKPENTNLYVSNLHKSVNEDGLKTIFETVYPKEAYPQYRAGSCKILKDTCGISRGVGFARFETPEICEQIIATFNNKNVGEGQSATTIQIRYADTEEQKDLKTRTAYKRSFKAREYNEAAYGIPFESNSFSPASSAYASPLPTYAPGVSGSWSQSPASSISPSSYGTYPPSVIRLQQASNGVLPAVTVKPDIKLAPAPTRQTARIKIESPSVTAAAKKAAAETVEDVSTDEESSTKSGDDTLVNKSSASGAGTSDAVVSPTKSKL